MASSAPDCWAEIARPRFSTLDAVINDVYNGNPKKALQIVEAELLNLQHVLSVVRWLRNGCRPVSHIPPEILAHIFWFCGQDPTRFPEDRVRCLIDVSHVCHRWREAALAHAYLWGTVTSLALGEKWMAEMLRRAKEAPLMVHSSAMPSLRSRPVKPLDLSMFLPLLSRIETLELSDDVDDLAGFFRLFVEPAPILESLSLTSKKALKVPQDLFASHAPRLRILQLSGLAISWASPILTNLTTLDLRMAHWRRDRSHRPLLMQFFELFEKMQRLEVLRMVNYLPQISPTGNVNDHIRRTPIELPHLSEIELQGSMRECVVVITSIQALQATVLNLSFDADENHNDLAALVPAIRTVSGNSGDKKPWRGLSVSSSHGFEIKAWKSSHPLQQTQYPEGDVYIHINYKFNHARDMDPLRAIYEALCLPDLSMLSMEWPSLTCLSPLASYWLPPQCQQLRHIYLYDGNRASRLIDALRPVVTSSGENAPCTTTVPYPHVRTLDLTCIDDMDPRGKAFRETAIKVVIDREALKAPLDTIRLKSRDGPGFFRFPWSFVSLMESYEAFCLCEFKESSGRVNG